MCIHSPQTQPTLGSVFITGIVILSWSSSSVISLVSLQEPSSPLSKSIWFCKTTTLITAVSSHVMKQGSIRTISIQHQNDNSFYRFISMQLSKPYKSFSFYRCTGNCCSVSHAFTCPSQNPKRHYRVQRRFALVPIRGQRNQVHISNLIYIILTFKQSSDVGTAN